MNELPNYSINPKTDQQIHPFQHYRTNQTHPPELTTTTLNHQINLTNLSQTKTNL